MSSSFRIKFLTLAAVAVSLIGGMVAQPAQALTSSQNIAYIQSQNVVNGGAFPFSTNPAFAGFNFYQLLAANVSSANLGPGGVCGASACDTVLLNVVSSGFYCNVTGLSATAKTALVSFVNNGGKLIIYDSECSSQDYSWLPYPFTTNNPGAAGATGTVSIVEDNDLSHTDSANSKYINAAILGSQTDAVGDMNVMTTRDPNWCLDMSGTNTNNVTGPAHTYARYGNGLFIYNGFDVDYMTSSTTPVATSGAGNLAKIWLQELQVPFNPTPNSALPCGVSVLGITLSPSSAINDLGQGQTSHTVTASVKDLTGTPEVGVTVTFTVLSGPNSGASGTCSVNSDCTTDASGEVSFTYNSNGTVGTDTIQACFTDAQGQVNCSQTVEKQWIETAQRCDVNGDGSVDILDINAIFAARGQTVPPASAVLDIDGDGLITVNDARGCVLQCTKPRCAQ